MEFLKYSGFSLEFAERLLVEELLIFLIGDKVKKNMAVYPSKQSDELLLN